jgi:hypothetical protein
MPKPKATKVFCFFFSKKKAFFLMGKASTPAKPGRRAGTPPGHAA